MTTTEDTPTGARSVIHLRMNTVPELTGTQAHVLVSTTLHAIALAKVIADTDNPPRVEDETTGDRALVRLDPRRGPIDPRDLHMGYSVGMSARRPAPRAWHSLDWDDAVAWTAEAGMRTLALTYRNPFDVWALLEADQKAGGAVKSILDFIANPRARMRRLRAEADIYEAVARRENAAADKAELEVTISREWLPMPLSQDRSGAALNAVETQHELAQRIAEGTSIPRSSAMQLLNNGRSLQAVRVLQEGQPEVRVVSEGQAANELGFVPPR